MILLPPAHFDMNVISKENQICNFIFLSVFIGKIGRKNEKKAKINKDEPIPLSNVILNLNVRKSVWHKNW